MIKQNDPKLPPEVQRRVLSERRIAEDLRRLLEDIPDAEVTGADVEGLALIVESMTRENPHVADALRWLDLLVNRLQFGDPAI
jgi:hypothetical protein